MTVIIAIRDGKRIVVGGDSCSVAGNAIGRRKDPKVVRIGRLLIGLTGISWRPLQAVQVDKEIKRLEPPARNGFEFMVRDFVPALRKCLTAAGWTQVKDSREDDATTFLVCFGASIFVVYSDFQVEYVSEPYRAIGCGYAYAMGSLYTSEGDAEGRLLLAIEAAEHHSAGVARPFVIEATE